MLKKLLTIFAVILLVNIASAQVVITDDITTNTTWTSNNEYLLDGLIFVDSLATLTIQEGTIIKAKVQSNITTGDGASALIIRRGGKLMAEGTADNPIIFTTELDDITDPYDLLPTDRGLWGGLILLGNAITNQPTTQNQIEGVPSSENAKFGGNNDNDNSGTLKYISIRHGGFSISGVSGDEINGLTMGAIGDQTVIEHIEVFANLDDGYEWFGGTVNTKWIVAAFCGDDCFDYDQGFRGKGQFWFSIQGEDEAGRGGEHDGGDDDETGLPYATPMIVNATYIGSGMNVNPLPAGDGNDRALYFRDNAGGNYYNSIFYDFAQTGITIEDLGSGEDSRSRLENGDLNLESNFWYNFGDGNLIDSIAKQSFVKDYLDTHNNFVQDPGLTMVDRGQNGDLDPRPSTGSPASNGAMTISDSWFDNVSYFGAFNPNASLWTAGWTALSQYNITGIREINNNQLPENFELSQNYPNPFNPSTKIQFSLPEASNVKLSVFNVLGEKVAEVFNGFKNAGSFEVNFDASSLTSGIYIYKLETDFNVISKKMTLLK